jgi:hypothetical protein
MKAIIYAGIGLFSVATVYGVADYYSSKRKGTLDKLYVEEDIPPTPKPETKNTIVISSTNTAPDAEVAKAVTTKARSGKRSKVKKEIRMEDFSRARIPEPATIVIPAEEQAIKEEVKVLPAKLVVPGEKTEVIEPERKLSLDKFSRAPLRKYKPVKKIAIKE